MSLPIEFTLAQIPKHVRNAVVNGAYTKVGVVRSVIAQDGLPSMAIVDFDDETGVESKLMNGAGTPTHPGMTVRVERQGGVIDPTWKIVDVLSGPRISFGEPVVALMAKPVVPGASSGGVYTESQTATADNPNAIADPGAAVKARVYLYPRSVVLGSYSAYQQRAKAIRVQGRELGDTEWPDQFSDWPINPNALLYGYTSGAISASATSITFVTSVDRVNEMLVDQPAYWQIESEIVLAIAEATVTPGQYTLAVVAHNGVDDATLGQGFVASASGRGLEGTTAASHAHNSVVTLLSASVAPGDLRPGTDYELRVAFVNASNQAGPWSDIVGVTTWEQPVPPAAPDNLVVAHLSSVLQADWDPVILDANGHYRSDVKRYLVVRHTAALAVGLSLLQVLSAGATPVDDTPATVSKIPATAGHGNFVGVAAVGSEGLLSNWSWASDTVAPPQPDPENWTVGVVPGAIQFQYHPTLNLVDGGSHTDTCHNYAGSGVAYNLLDDEGFAGWKLYYSAASNGSSPQYIGSFGRQSTGPIPAAAMAGYYKLVPVDWSGNYPTPGSSEWKFAPILFPTNDEPLNGNFQIPRPDIAFPAYWEVASNTFTQPGSGITYETSGGLVGNRVLKIVMASGETGSVTIEQTVTGKMFPLNGDSSWSAGEVWSLAGLEFWHREGSASDKFIIDIDLELYSDDEGTTSIGGLGGGPSQNFYTYDPGIGDQWGQVASTDWNEGHVLSAGGVTTAALPKVGGKPTARRYKMTIAFWPGDTAAKTLYFDDIRLVQLFGEPNPPDDWMLPSLL